MQIIKFLIINKLIQEEVRFSFSSSNANRLVHDPGISVSDQTYQLSYTRYPATGINVYTPGNCALFTFYFRVIGI